MTAFTKYQKNLSILLLSTGIINSLLAYWAENFKPGYGPYDAYYGYLERYDYPFTLMWVMSFGQILCLITFNILRAYYARTLDDQSFADEDPRILAIRGSQDFNPLLFLRPAGLDILATFLMSKGVDGRRSYAANCQMYRGVAVILVAYLSKKYVGRTMEKKHWRGVEIIFLGFLVIALGYAFLKKEHSGDVYILLSQIVLACQMVYEEKYVLSMDISPLQAVGWEGIFGFSILSTLLIPFHFVGIEDVPKALNDIVQNHQLPIGLAVINIAFFNFAGLSITKELSATHRMVLDSLRSLWIPLLGSRPINVLGSFIVLRGITYFYKIKFPKIKFSNITFPWRKKEQPPKNDTTEELQDEVA